MRKKRKLVVGTFLTLDGVMQAPGAPEEDRSGGFEHGGWSAPHFDDLMGQLMVEWMSRAGGFVLGRHTYEIFAVHWPHIDGDDPIARKLNEEPKYVASRTLKKLDWKNSHLLEGDVSEQIRKLKAEEGGELQVHGSGNLIQTLLRDGVIDEFHLWTFPIVLGKGKRLFPEGTGAEGFKLIDTKTSTTGCVLQVLEAAGKPTYGSFAREEPSAEEFARRERIRTATAS